MQIYGWGRYPRVEAQALVPNSSAAVREQLRGRSGVIARGLGRSYGDSSLSATVLDTRHLDLMIDFDSQTGYLTCEAGVSLDAIVRTFVPKGWFLSVSPGTRFVTVGGAIASDVHGKNHHASGTFGEHVVSMKILLGNGVAVTASPTENSDLFHATCGGMGLTGVILSATFALKRITSSNMVETTIRVPDLGSALEAFEETSGANYSVAWIDCLATGRKLGRSILTVGEHHEDGPLHAHANGGLTVPFDLPSGALNKFTTSAFNDIIYGKGPRGSRTRVIPYAPFFYPLDAVKDWNRFYGAPGFVQYQFVLPFEAGQAGLRDVLTRIARSGRGSMLAVLKVFGRANANHLSFPMEGYNLALDFAANPATFTLLSQLDAVVQSYNGRLYLTKDSRMSPEMFHASYARVAEFEDVRRNYHAVGAFSSLQSVRLGLS